MSRQIQNDEQYQKSLDWLVAEAERLEREEIHDPLLKSDEKAAMLRKYDFVEAGILDYQQRKRLGREVTQDQSGEPEPVPAEMNQHPESDPPLQQPQPEPEPPKKTINISAWLDDDD